ncbi:MAG TPA: hypothetical protein VFB12_30200 [Ktedonobacteraceae bacterium]|nr:hypothetical protein [Ktedonobacteraceae bacterium]
MDSMSEVARIRAQIALEYEACSRIFTQLTITAHHQFIEHRQEKLGMYFQELTQYMSSEKAVEIFLEVERSGHERTSPTS